MSMDVDMCVCPSNVGWLVGRWLLAVLSGRMVRVRGPRDRQPAVVAHEVCSGLREDHLGAGVDTAGRIDRDGDVRMAASVELFDGGPEEIGSQSVHVPTDPDGRCSVVDGLAVRPVTQDVVGVPAYGRGTHRWSPSQSLVCQWGSARAG